MHVMIEGAIESPHHYILSLPTQLGKHQGDQKTASFSLVGFIMQRLLNRGQRLKGLISNGWQKTAATSPPTSPLSLPSHSLVNAAPHNGCPSSSSSTNRRYFSSLLDDHNILDSSQADVAPPMNITAFGDKAFQVNDKFIKQPILLLPHSVYMWQVKDFDDITVESLSLFTLVYPTIEILFIGTGETTKRIDPEITKYFKSKGIVLEVASTIHAASSFNVLNAEGRNIGAALLTLQPIVANEVNKDDLTTIPE